MTAWKSVGIVCLGLTVLLGITASLWPGQHAMAAPGKAEARSLTLGLGRDVKLETVLIPAGEFMMGSPGEPKDNLGTDERPQHRVKITRPFFIGKFEVTQAQWRALMGDNPSKFTGDDKLPVEAVSWDDAQGFCRRASKLTGRQVRLPTEAEWEYACRAGTADTYAGVDSEKQLGDYAFFGVDQTKPVGGKKPNTWGLYDMLGNVWEWCQDWYGPYSAGEQTNPAGPATGQVRVLRGGCWNSDAYNCRVANRLWSKAATRRYNVVGFRVAITAE
jgi:formylglycine-generating enzyme required for sulfatase activity